MTVAIYRQLAQFGANIEIIAPATFVSLVIPLAVFFAFQRYFVEGLLAGSVKRVSGTCAIVGGGLAGLCAMRPSGKGLEPAEIAVFGTDPDRGRVARALRRHPSAADALRGDGHCAPSSFPGLAVRTAIRRRSPAPLVQSIFDRYHPTVDEFLDHVDELRAATVGTRASTPRVSSACGRSRAASSERPRRLPVLLAPGHPGLAARGPRGRPARGARLRAARVRGHRGDRGGGHGRRDRVARARRRGVGDLGAPSRARAAPLNLPRELFSRRAWPASTRRPRTSGSASWSGSARRPIRPAAAGTSRSRPPGGQVASTSRRS